MRSIKLTLPLTVFTNVFYQGIGKVIVVFFGLLTTILLTRYLGVVGFGQFNLIFAFLGFASTFADFGLGTLLTREIAKGKTPKKYLNTIFTLRIILGILVLVIFAVLSYLFPYPQIVKSGIVIYSFGSFFLLVYNLYHSFFQAKLHLEKHLLAQSIGSFVALLLTFLLINLRATFEWFVLAQVFGNLTIFFVGQRLLDKKMTLEMDISLFWEIIKSAWPLALTGIIAIFYSRADIMILSFLKDPKILPDVGVYSTAYRIFETLVIFGTFFTNALFPVFVRELKNKGISRLLKESLLISSFAAVLSIVFLIFLAKYIILIVAGGKFTASILPLQILGFAFALSLFLNIYYSLIVALNKQKQTILIGTVALVFNLVANILLIPKFSYLASSIITVLTSAIILVGYIFVIGRLASLKRENT